MRLTSATHVSDGDAFMAMPTVSVAGIWKSNTVICPLSAKPPGALMLAPVADVFMSLCDVLR